MEHRMKELSTDLPSCCYLHEGSGAIKSSLPQMGFYTYIALAQVRKKRQIRSSLLLDMPRSDNHETLSWRNFNEQRLHHSLVEMEMQPTAPTQSSLCIWHSVCSWVFLSLRETSAIEQRQHRAELESSFHLSKHHRKASIKENKHYDDPRINFLPSKVSIS